MEHPAVGRLRCQFGEGAPRLAALYVEEVRGIPRDGASPVHLHRLAGVVGILGEVGLARRLRDASRGDAGDAGLLVAEARALADALAPLAVQAVLVH